MDPILLDIFIIAVNYLYMGIWNCTLTMYTIQICTWGVSNTDIKLHQPPMEDNWNEDLLYVIGVYSTFKQM